MCVSASIHVDYSKAVRVLATDVYMDYIVGLVAEIAQEAEELKKRIGRTDGPHEYVQTIRT